MEQPPVKRPYDEPSWSALPAEDFHLEVLKEGKIVETLPLTGKAFFTLGRQHGLVDLPMDHPSLSRLHAVLNFRDDGALMLRDLGSAQGTLLNKEPCDSSTYYRLYVGDLLRFGASTRQYIVGGPVTHMREEYQSANLDRYREKQAERSARAQEAKDKAAQRESFGWGMREDAEQEEEEVEGEEELPEYLQKMRKDEHFERKFGEKFAADLGATNEKDAELVEKVRRKERKIQNMQEEVRRIYMKEGQEGGLTAGQTAAVARNDKAVAVLVEEVGRLVGQIKAKNADRGVGAGAGAGAVAGAGVGGRKRELEGGEDELRDVTSQTADASTNWRLRKKLLKTANQGGGGGTSTGGGGGGGGDALSYEQIHSLLQTQTQASEGVRRSIAEAEAFLHSARSQLPPQGTQSAGESLPDLGLDLDQVMLRGRVAECEDGLRRLRNEQGTLGPSVERLQRLLRIATPALGSLVRKGVVEGGIARGVEVGAAAPTAAAAAAAAAASVPARGPLMAEEATKPEVKEVEVEAVGTDAEAEAQVEAETETGAEAKAGVGVGARVGAGAGAGADIFCVAGPPLGLEALQQFVEQEKQAEAEAVKAREREQRERERERERDAGEGKKKPPSRPTPAPTPAPTSASASASASAPAKGLLQGGERVWVPPPKQKGDGKTSLNAKYGY